MYLINNFLLLYHFFIYCNSSCSIIFFTSSYGNFSDLFQVCCAIKFLHKKCVFVGEKIKFFPTNQDIFVRKQYLNALNSYFKHL